MNRLIRYLGAFVLIALMSGPVFSRQDQPAASASGGTDRGAQQQKPAEAPPADPNSPRGRGPQTGQPDTAQQPPLEPGVPEAPPAELDQRSLLESPIVLLFAGALLLVALGLHGVHLMTEARVRQELAGIHATLQRLSSANLGANAGQLGAVENLSDQLNRQKQTLGTVSAQIEEMGRRLASFDQKIVDTSKAVAMAAHWMGQAQIDEALQNAGGQMAETDRALAIKIVERYKEISNANVNRVKPLTEAVASLVERQKERRDAPAELISRAESLQHDIQQFDRWNSELNDRLASLQRGAFPDRYTAFKAKQGQLAERINNGATPIHEYVNGYRELLDRYFPGGVSDNSISIPPAEQEADLKKMVSSQPDYLMDWFDKLYQLQSQVAASEAQGTRPDSQTAAQLAQIQSVAREALGKFDIQPEEIQVGQTSYDRRLHDAALITQSSQFPANTVIGIHQCGFRKASTGEVLRRPKVVVAGVGVA
jgi:molecular chaperone GrpE (heat shock protein)